MCGRFSLTATPDDVRALFAYIDLPNFPPRYNIAPTQPIATVRREHGERHFALVRWGLVPSWVKDPASFSLLINARAETAAEKPSFRAAMRHHRCLIPASGFYEWRRTPEGKQPYWISPADGGLMAFAGLWDTWSDPDGGDIDTGAVLTTTANKTIGRIHHRMPAILMPEAFDDWLDTGNVMVRDAKKLLVPAPEDYLTAIPVSPRVNKVSNDDPDLQDEVEPEDRTVRTERSDKPKKASAGAAKPDDGQMDLF
ncbi:SOS response-associated peptidase [uncultured Roseibium sp.]|uniref:SOS response-associated peptidase n=1 Tax=uncultured Roseibium sp. TaxID=1936171 RepID=UPI003217F367